MVKNLSHRLGTAIRVLTVLVVAFLLCFSVYSGAKKTNGKFSEQKVVAGAMRTDQSAWPLPRVFTLCSLFDEYYDKETILITPFLDKEENKEFNKFFQFHIRWQILLALRYPKSTDFEEYQWHVDAKRAKFLVKQATNSEKINGVTYYIFPKKSEERIAVYLYKKNVFLLPFSL